MDVFKTAGALLILFSASGFGIWWASQRRGRLAMLEGLRQMVYFLKGEIVYHHAALEEAFQRVGNRNGGPMGDLFENTAKAIRRQKGEPFCQIWKQEVEKFGENRRGLPIKKEDLNHLNCLGNHLGYLDVDMQEKTLSLYLEQLDLTIEYLRQSEREACRLSTVLGIMGGMFLVIAMY